MSGIHWKSSGFLQEIETLLLLWPLQQWFGLFPLYCCRCPRWSFHGIDISKNDKVPWCNAAATNSYSSALFMVQPSLIFSPWTLQSWCFHQYWGWTFSNGLNPGLSQYQASASFHHSFMSSNPPERLLYNTKYDFQGEQKPLWPLEHSLYALTLRKHLPKEFASGMLVSS